MACTEHSRDVAAQVVPVYSSSADTDYVLRGYDKCPVFTEALQVFRASQAFTQKQAASEVHARRGVCCPFVALRRTSQECRVWGADGHAAVERRAAASGSCAVIATYMLALVQCLSPDCF